MLLGMLNLAFVSISLKFLGLETATCIFSNGT